MTYVNAIFGWLWRQRAFMLTTIVSALLFFVWIFPFSDLSIFVTTTVARATGNQVYLQFETMDLHLLPQPAVSATGVSVDTGMPTLQAKWAKITPSLLSAVLNLPSLLQAQGDPATSRALLTKFGVSVDAEDILGGDISLSLKPGKKSEAGNERSRVQLAVENLNLKAVQEWSDLSVKMQGQANLETDVLFTPSWQEQPEGDYLIQISRFNLPASTVMVPMGEASMPINLPTLTLANVTLRGRLVGGNLMIEEGSFGQASDPVHGRIKGQLGLRFQPMGNAVTPILGSYNLTVDLNTNAAIQKELGFAFLLFDSAKTPASGGGARYLFRAQGSGTANPPAITRLSSF